MVSPFLMALWKKTKRYLFKLPTMLFLMVLGFTLEYIFTFPFVMVYYIDRLANKSPSLLALPTANTRAGGSSKNFILRRRP